MDIQKISSCSCKREPQCHDVTICLAGNSGHVHPGAVVVHPGDHITFAAIDTEVYLYLPDIGTFRQREGTRVELTPDQAINVIYVPMQGTRVFEVTDAPIGRYPYGAFCKEVNAFAVGNSDPTIIIRTDG